MFIVTPFDNTKKKDVPLISHGAISNTTTNSITDELKTYRSL